MHGIAEVDQAVHAPVSHKDIPVVGVVMDDPATKVLQNRRDPGIVDVENFRDEVTLLRGGNGVQTLSWTRGVESPNRRNGALLDGQNWQAFDRAVRGASRGRRNISGVFSSPASG